ncbi:hypothetical protein [Desulfogranum mediterraneum]|uniref:hypothetical protein n=1 Tax=Desulfogranum mediterraneum TaxID=160661 RepID=UPI00041B7331|nr:hypothetical protein [Desulfogranum mediterraneum]
MSDYFEAILIGVLIATVSLIFPWLHKKYTFKRDSARIITFIRDSKYAFRSTRAIMDGTTLSQERVEELCQKNEQIIQNKKNPHTWRVL